MATLWGQAFRIRSSTSSPVAILCERDGLQAGFPITKRYFGQGVIDGATKPYYTTDRLGSVRELVDETGEVVADYRYSIYGERTKIGGDQDSDQGYAGLFHHGPSGLDLATYRLYDWRQRRFISRDPLGEDVDYNLYRYANNNLVMYVDPEGLTCHSKFRSCLAAVEKQYLDTLNSLTMAKLRGMSGPSSHCLVRLLGPYTRCRRKIMPSVRSFSSESLAVVT